MTHKFIDKKTLELTGDNNHVNDKKVVKAYLNKLGVVKHKEFRRIRADYLGKRTTILMKVRYE